MNFRKSATLCLIINFSGIVPVSSSNLGPINKIFFLDPDATDIEDMLMLVNQYGLSHVCAEPEFIGRREDYYFPYLDIKISYLRDEWVYATLNGTSPYEIEFYYRGALDRNFKFKNLFEYLLWLFSVNDR